jgi:hypothetical protein
VANMPNSLVRRRSSSSQRRCRLQKSWTDQTFVAASVSRFSDSKRFMPSSLRTVILLKSNVVENELRYSPFRLRSVAARYRGRPKGKHGFRSHLVELPHVLSAQVFLQRHSMAKGSFDVPLATTPQRTVRPQGSAETLIKESKHGDMFEQLEVVRTLPASRLKSKLYSHNNSS